MTQNDIARFWKYVDKKSDDECWPWTASTIKGYGRFKYKYETILAHRFMWQYIMGYEILTGLEMDHICNVRICVNPKHLRVVTHQQNIDHRESLRTHCKRGHEWTAANIYIQTKTGKQKCIKCMRIHEGRR